MDLMTTGEIAERADVNLHTVRYYEKRKLLPEPPRTAAGYRQYGPEHVAYIRFIKRAQSLGFTLEEIRELLALRAAPGIPPPDVHVGGPIGDSSMYDIPSALHPAVESLPLTLAALPLDPASIFVYVLLIAGGIAIWKGSRSS